MTITFLSAPGEYIKTTECFYIVFVKFQLTIIITTTAFLPSVFDLPLALESMPLIRLLRGSVLAAVLCLGPIAVHSATYNLVKDYSGSGFFDEWDFYGSWDNLTLGALQFGGLHSYRVSFRHRADTCNHLKAT